MRFHTWNLESRCDRVDGLEGCFEIFGCLSLKYGLKYGKFGVVCSKNFFLKVCCGGWFVGNANAALCKLFFLFFVLFYKNL